MKLERGYDERCTILNVRLSKTVGLYQILDPTGPKMFGYRVSHVVVTIFLIFESVLLLFNLMGVYYWIENSTQTTIQLAVFSNFSFACYKIGMLIRKTDDVRRCVDVACDDFLEAAGNYRESYFHAFRSKSVTITNAIASMGFVILTVFVAVPVVFDENVVVLKSVDGRWHSYHLSAFNTFFPVTSDTYNRYFAVIYVLEALFGIVYVVFSHVFDSLLISMCYAIRCQMKTINKAIATLAANVSTADDQGKYRISGVAEWGDGTSGGYN